MDRWIRITYEYTDNALSNNNEYYYIGCIVRFATIIPARSINSGRELDNDGNLTIIPKGGLYNVQATADGQLVIPQRSTDNSEPDSIYRQFNNITNPPYASYVVFARY